MFKFDAFPSKEVTEEVNEFELSDLEVVEETADPNSSTGGRTTSGPLRWTDSTFLAFFGHGIGF